MPPVREEVLNVVLAGLLDDRGLLSLPETIRRAVSGRGRTLPDVTVADLHGVRIVIEGRIDGSGVPDSLLQDARQRVEQGVSAICLAVLYPSDLRNVSSLPTLRNRLEHAELRARVISEGSDGDWSVTTVDGLAEILRSSYDLLVSEDVVLSAVEELTGAIDSASEIIASAPAAPTRLRALLGVAEGHPEPDGDETDE